MNANAVATSQFAREGFRLIHKLIEPVLCDRLNAELTPLFTAQQQSSSSRIGGVRNLLQTIRLVAEVASSAEVQSALRRELATEAVPVRAIFFDKTPESNWNVPWHQDLAIAVQERIATPGFGGWSVKDGIVHTHPPEEILEGMVTVRLHLDDCPASNGALQVIPGSHRLGKLAAETINQHTKQAPVICEACQGDALLMRPLLLHASSPANTPAHRRILHIEYSTTRLPNGLKWFSAS